MLDKIVVAKEKVTRGTMPEKESKQRERKKEKERGQLSSLLSFCFSLSLPFLLSSLTPLPFCLFQGGQANYDELDELITFANISNDEADYGQALQLGNEDSYLKTGTI